MSDLAKRALFIAAASALVVGCGNEAQGPFHGACEEVMASDGTTSCWDVKAETLKKLEDARVSICESQVEDLLPVWSRCVRDHVLGGCSAAFGVADDPSVMIRGIKWYYETATIQSDADVMILCSSGDGGWLLPGGPFVPPDGDFPPAN